MNRRVVSLLPLVLAGCGIGAVFAPVQDDLSTWQRVPLEPDPGLNEAASKHSSCRIDIPDGVPVTILLQDRRTEVSAAFLVRGPETVGSCLLSRSGGGAGGSSMPARQQQPLGDAFLVVDEDGSGGVGDGTAGMLGGRAAPNVAAVRVVVREDLLVEASLDGGFWLAWWPDGGRPSNVVAFGASGAEIGILTLGAQGWSAE